MQSSRDAQQIVQQEASDARDSVSGVNLDEEAANLIKYQQAYQAAAQMIRVASEPVRFAAPGDEQVIHG